MFNMWILVFAILAACKVTAARWLYPGPAPVAYWIAWPGLDPRPFRRCIPAPAFDWRHGTRRLVAGLAGFAFARGLWHVAPFAAVWIAMMSSLLCAHFGAIHLLAGMLRRRGIAVEPLMDRPMSATTLTDFWGRRWNRAFRDFAHALVFLPVARRWGARPASVAAFLFSGVVHDVVVSIPAGSGYGMPTLYFLLQALGVSLERRCGFRGRVWTLAWLAPMPLLLFPPAFVERVMRPFFERILFL